MVSAEASVWPPTESRIRWNGPIARAVSIEAPTPMPPLHHCSTVLRNSARRTWPHTIAPDAAASCTAMWPTPPLVPSTRTFLAEQQPALPQRMQCGEAGHRQGRRLRVAHAIGQHRDVLHRHANAFGPGAAQEIADDARAGRRATALLRGLLDHAGEIPARTRARLRLGDRALGLAAIERDRGDAHGDVGRRGRSQRCRLHGQPARRVRSRRRWL